MPLKRISARWILPILLLIAIGFFGWRKYRPKVLGEAYASERSVPVWNSTAEVRQVVATLPYGERVFVIGHDGNMTEVRNDRGKSGWVEARLLMNSALWLRAARLLDLTRSIPVQGRGHTKTITNVRIEPGRSSPRIYQFGRGVPVELLARGTAEIPAAPEESEAAVAGGAKAGLGDQPRREDWFLVRRVTTAEHEGAPAQAGQPAEERQASPAVPVAGWVVARFVDLDLPEAIRDYASSADMRVIAWFELNRVRGDSGMVPQYLAVGNRGSEGQPCDFTMLRVYTWSRVRHQYETAYVESGLCGRLPIRVTQIAAGPEFRFAQMGNNNAERAYVMRQTIVRRVRSGEGSLKKRPR